MAEIRIASLADGRSLEYDPKRLEQGGIIVEAFYLGKVFSDAELRLWVKDHKMIRYTSFLVGAVLCGERAVDEDELKFLLSTMTSAQTQFFNQALELALED